MALNNNINTIIHRFDSIILSAFSYSQVYASAIETVLINGASVDLTAGDIPIDIVVNTISAVTTGATTTVYLLGSPKFNPPIECGINGYDVKNGTCN